MAESRFVPRTTKYRPPEAQFRQAVRGFMLPARAVSQRNNALLIDEMRRQADAYVENTQAEHKELYDGQEAVLVPGMGDTMERPYAVKMTDRRSGREFIAVGGGVSTIGELADIAAEAHEKPREYEGERPDINLAWKRQIEYELWLRTKNELGRTVYGALPKDR